MSQTSSLPAGLFPEMQEALPGSGTGYEAGDEAVGGSTVPRGDHLPSVSRLFARIFGVTAAEAHGATFAQTEWQDTEWQDTRSLPSGGAGG